MNSFLPKTAVKIPKSIRRKGGRQRIEPTEFTFFEKGVQPLVEGDLALEKLSRIVSNLVRLNQQQVNLYPRLHPARIMDPRRLSLLLAVV